MPTEAFHGGSSDDHHGLLQPHGALLSGFGNALNACSRTLALVLCSVIRT